jgi:hypothetical protein
VVGANSFCLLPYARIVGIIWLARTAVKVERSEFILNLDGGRSQPYRFSPGRGKQGLCSGRDLFPDFDVDLQRLCDGSDFCQSVHL